MTVTAMAGWYGANRILAPQVAKELQGAKLVAIPFAGGMSEERKDFLRAVKEYHEQRREKVDAEHPAH